MPRLLTSLKWLAIIATLVHLIVPDSLFLLSAFLVMAPQQLLLTGFGILVLWRTLRPPPSPQLWFGLAFAGMFIFQGHDAFIFFLSPREQYIEAINWMHLSLPLVAIAFYSHLQTRFVNALQDSEALNSELESRVRETTFALEQSYRENRQMELERAAAEERSKIYRDLHDDVGSRLVSIIHTDNQQTSELARDALESLRQTIHTVNHQDESLKDFVANLTEEARLRLNGAGLAFSSSAALESDPALAPSVTYHLSRIVRELISNILHHANATGVELAISYQDNNLSISIADNGEGLDPVAPDSGGLANIRFRAERLKAEVHWQNTAPGTRCVLHVPIQAQARL